MRRWKMPLKYVKRQPYGWRSPNNSDAWTSQAGYNSAWRHIYRSMILWSGNFRSST